ncbi:MAG: NADPH-dependent 7-cyano-7-deazaguanine reductase QueF [bacterium]|nr:NADPH-dependent 7-cyano-7-deazaguanine reductase QueF [bacterium]
MPKATGKQFDFLEKKHIQTKYLETFDFKSEQQITIETKEFSAVCPFSGLPDIGYIKIDYYPDGGKCIELKSLKYYFVSFRNVGIYQEAVTKKIYEDLKNILNTQRIRIITTYNTRGGFDTTCRQGEIS